MLDCSLAGGLLFAVTQLTENRSTLIEEVIIGYMLFGNLISMWLQPAKLQ